MSTGNFSYGMVEIKLGMGRPNKTESNLAALVFTATPSPVLAHARFLLVVRMISLLVKKFEIQR